MTIFRSACIAGVAAALLTASVPAMAQGYGYGGPYRHGHHGFGGYGGYGGGWHHRHRGYGFGGGYPVFGFGYRHPHFHHRYFGAY